MALLDSYAPAAKFPTKGVRVGGKVVRDAAEIQQRDFDSGDLLFWDDGNPRMQLVVTVDTGVIDPTIEDDDGERAIYIKGQMLAATKAAVRKVKAREIKAGGEFWVTYTDDEPLPKGKRGFPKKLYEVVYVPPAAGAGEDDQGDAPTAKDPHQASLKGAVAKRAAAKKTQDDDPPPF